MQRFSPRFRSQQFFVSYISEEGLSPSSKRFVWKSHVLAHPDERQYGRNQQKHLSLSFAAKAQI